ncbi:MAG TPA: OmpH family outer membrane protein [Blastocatellia bacterium]|nr:OmpH family outer membrane protein [Blastocatellia bacterium]
MLKTKFVAVATVLIASLAGVASAQQAMPAGAGGAVPDGKIAVMNTEAFRGGINELKVKYDQVDAQFKDRYQKLQTVENQLKQMESDIRTKCPNLTPEKCQELQNGYEELKRRGTRDYEDLKADYERTVDTATKPIRDKLFQFVTTYATQRGIVTIFNLAAAAQNGALAYWNPGADVTDDFIVEYNKANPVSGAVAPAASAPATTPTTTPAKPPIKKP